MEMPVPEDGGLSVLPGQRLRVDVPITKSKNDDTPHISYHATVVRVERRDGYMLVACKSIRARICRGKAAPVPAYIM